MVGVECPAIVEDDGDTIGGSSGGGEALLIVMDTNIWTISKCR